MRVTIQYAKAAMSFALMLSLTLGLAACSDDSPATLPEGANPAPSADTTVSANEDMAISGEDDVMAPEPDTGPMVSAELFDFEAQAPWYRCSEDPYPAEVTEVTAFDGVYQYFGNENRREVSQEVVFPEGGSWAQVGLYFELSCPDNGLCDHWDRSGSLQLQLDSEDPEAPEYLELLRHITPYKLGMCQYIDITPLAPLLKGTRTISSWIDTWVGPGHSDGEGWKVTARFVFYPGPSAAPSEIINVWGRRSITVGEVEEDVNVPSQITPFTFEVPATATRVEAHLITTGHSFGNALNCAEFCPMRHDLIINGMITSTNPWRSDCPDNPVSPQYGTWEYPRNGWCPGAVAIGDLVDLTPALLMGQSNTLSFDIRLANGAEYNNNSPVDLLPYTLTSLKLYVYE